MLENRAPSELIQYSKEVASAQIVAVKMIDIDESDMASPYADTFNDFMKEVNALKLLREKKAKNINNVIDAFPLGQTMWMITDYCGGGSVATLVRAALFNEAISNILR